MGNFGIWFFMVTISSGVLLVNSQLFELRAPRLSTIFNRITNTTFGILRNGLSILVNTVDRIVNTFGRIDDRLRALLEEFRKQIIRGIPELNIPVLDPLHIERIDFDVSQDAARLKGKAENVTIKYISKFIVDEANVSELGNWRFRLDLNITFPYLTGTGMYTLNGIIGEAFHIFGEGPFWIHLINLKVQTSTVIQFGLSGLKITNMKIQLKLGKLENDFSNLMNDKENGALINKAISSIAPEALDILWPNLKKPVEKQVIKYINNILANNTIANLVRRLFNIG